MRININTVRLPNRGIAIVERRKNITGIVVVAIVGTIILAGPATLMFGAVAYNAWVNPLVPRPDRSDDVEAAIRSRYQSPVTDLVVRHVNDIRVGTDFPFNHTYREWGYRARYRLEGLNVTFNVSVSEPEDLRQSRERIYHGMFPDEFGLTDSEFKTVLRTYAKGSGKRSFSEMKDIDWIMYSDEDTVTLRDGRKYAKKWTFAIYEEVDDLRSFRWDYEEDAHIVAFDPKSGKAIYLGMWQELYFPGR